MRGSPQHPRGAAAPIGEFHGGIPRPFVAGDRPPAGPLHCRPVGTMPSWQHVPIYRRGTPADRHRAAGCGH